jgi:ERCC4-related helicase
MPLIDNKEVTLLEELKNALTTADAVDIFTGFFFFSGFSELADLIKDKKIRVIVGMDLDPKVVRAKKLTDESDLTRLRPDEPPLTTSAKVKNYLDSFIVLFENTDVFDKERMSGAIETFFNKIKDGSLEIRMNLNTHHGKFYLVHNKKEASQNGAFPGTRFMGSSNFSLAGLKGQGEINDSSREKEDFIKYTKVFETAWQDAAAVPVVEKHTAENFIREVKQSTSLFKDPAPYHAYLRVLKEEFHQPENSGLKFPNELTGGRFSDLEYQSDAIKDAIEKLKLYNGVIVADVVGLGKSIIASSVAANLKKKTIIITPPHLEQQWKDYAFEFGFNARVYTSGRIPQALEDNNYDEQQLVIVDEAHRYRNEDTYDYQSLHKLCVNKKVVLLTATPFNNDPKDVFALVKLFDPPSQSRINTVENLSMEFRELISEYKAMRRGLRTLDEKDIKERTEKMAQKMRRMIEPVVIRRSRLDLDKIERYKTDLKSQGYEFSKVLPPKLQKYELGPLRDLYFSTLERITDPENGFTAARYQPANHIEKQEQLKEIVKTYFNDSEDFKQAQINLAKFMRRFLVMRFESSVAAFQLTLKNFIAGHEMMLGWWEKFGYVPIYKKGKIPDPDNLELAEDISEISDDFSEADLQKVLANATVTKEVEKGLMLIPKSVMASSYAVDLKNDLQLLKDLYGQWFKEDKISHDPKIDDLKEQLKSLLTENSNRKIVIFTAYADTANYIYENLSEYRAFLYTGDIASKENKDIIAKNFDAGLPEDKQASDHDILVATDAISEGYNLHRAGVIINYDIPYNPVRVVQRIGRINRINKKMFDDLHIINCFPTAIGETEVQTKRISGLKVHLMNTLIGSDTQVLTDEEELESFFIDKVNEEQAKEDQESWNTKYRNLWDKVRYDHKLMQQIDGLKQRSFLARKSEHQGLLLFGQRGEGIPTYVISRGENTEPERASVEEALPLFEAIAEEKNISRTNKFQIKYEKSKTKLFQQTTLPDKKGRRGDAINILDFLAEKYPAARIHSKDAKAIIADLDGFPEGTLKRIYDLGKNYLRDDDFEGAYKELQEIASVDYMEAIQSRVSELANEKETLLIAEELV